MAEDSSVQTVIVLQPVNYHPISNHPHHPEIIQNMTNLSFSPQVAIPRPSNLPSDICTISSGVGNFENKKAFPAKTECSFVYQSIPSIRGEYHQVSALTNPLGVNHVAVPNIGVQNYSHAPDHVTYSQYHNGSIFSVPKSWPQDKKEDLVVTVYGLVKTLLG